MKKSQGETTTAKTLEEKFERGEDVLDYFNVRKARVIIPPSTPAIKKKPGYPATRNSARRAVVREKLGRYRKKK
jgi:hypothetical protein